MEEKEFVLEENKKIVIGNNFSFINLEKGIPDKMKKILIEFNEIDKIIFVPQEVNWIASIFYFFIMTFFQSLGNPISGTEARIEIILKNKNKVIIGVDSVKLKIIHSILKSVKGRLTNETIL